MASTFTFSAIFLAPKVLSSTMTLLTVKTFFKGASYDSKLNLLCQY